MQTFPISHKYPNDSLVGDNIIDSNLNLSLIPNSHLYLVNNKKKKLNQNKGKKI